MNETSAKVLSKRGSAGKTNDRKRRSFENGGEAIIKGYNKNLATLLEQRHGEQTVTGWRQKL